MCVILVAYSVVERVYMSTERLFVVCGCTEGGGEIEVIVSPPPFIFYVCDCRE